MPSFFLSSSIILLTFLSALPHVSPTTTICHSSAQRGLILRDTLFFMGGTYLLSGTTDVQPTPGLYSINLDSSFALDGKLDQSFVKNVSISTTPYVGSGVFWSDQNQTLLYNMASFADDSVPGQSALQAYDVKQSQWQSVSVSGGDFNRYDRYFGMHASTFLGAGGTTSYLAGGKDYVDGMVVFNASDPENPSWTNTTDGSIPYFWGATTQYVRFGDAGVLVSVGGFVTESTTQVAQRREMNSVQVYDIAAKQWFTVFATGNAPSPRSRPCSALSAAPDDSSMNMVIHGGWDETDVLNDVYVLTMPAFHWVKINTTGGAGDSSNRRLDAFCSTNSEGRGMFVIGGNGQFNADPTCTNGYPAIRVLDTSTWQWQKNYPLKDSKYQVPKEVIAVVGGDGNGGAKGASAFSQTLGDHQDVFSKTVQKYDPDNPPKSTASAAPSAAPKSGGSGASAGTIAGATVGAVVGVALVGAALWFFLIPYLRRRSRQRRHDDSNEEMMGDWQKKDPYGQAGQAGYYDQPKQQGLHEMGSTNPTSPSEMDPTSARLEAPDSQPNRLFELGADERRPER